MDKIVYKDGDDIKPLLKHPDVLEIVEKEGEKWLHVKDCEHEVYFATKSVGEYSWNEAINMGMELPSTDDFELIGKYKDEIDDFCEEKGIEAFDGSYLSSGECNVDPVRFCHGSVRLLDVATFISTPTYHVRPILAHKVES